MINLVSVHVSFEQASCVHYTRADFKLFAHDERKIFTINFVILKTELLKQFEDVHLITTFNS